MEYSYPRTMGNLHQYVVSRAFVAVTLGDRKDFAACPVGIAYKWEWLHSSELLEGIPCQESSLESTLASAFFGAPLRD